MSVINKKPFVEKVVGNSGIVNVIPPLPSENGTYVLKCVVLNGVHTFSWIVE